MGQAISEIVTMVKDFVVKSYNEMKELLFKISTHVIKVVSSIVDGIMHVRIFRSTFGEGESDSPVAEIKLPDDHNLDDIIIEVAEKIQSRYK